MSFIRGTMRGIPRDREFRYLRSLREFRRVLERERARADRSGDTFSLLLLGVKDWDAGRPTMLHLARTLRRRLRLTDEAGWIDRRHIAVAMPCTPAWGAWTLADDLCLSFPSDIPLPECKVYCYPEDRREEEKRDVDRHRGVVSRAPVAEEVESMGPLFIQRLPAWKRAMDVAGASVALLLVAPLMLAVAAAIKLTSRGPVLFTQLRAGRGGKPFVFYKFRSMIVDAEQLKASLRPRSEQDGPAFKMSDDPRITRLGRLLRRTSIDELPQLWNVLRGDMSLVGPRPVVLDEAAACRGWQRWRLDVTPGLTCVWQVRGRSRVSFADWMRMDAEYLRSKSFWGDVKLLLQTIPAVLLRRGAM